MKDLQLTHTIIISFNITYESPQNVCSLTCQSNSDDLHTVVGISNNILSFLQLVDENQLAKLSQSDRKTDNPKIIYCRYP